MERPDFLRLGEPARLIPVIADTRREQRTASVFLAVLAAVPEFANVILGALGQKVGKKTVVNTFTEIAFKSEPSGTTDRPDGLVELVSGNRKWIALVEIKIGRDRIGKDQLERYLTLARDNGIDCVVTLTNEFVALPTHHPVAVNKQLIRKLSLFHLSWSFVLTEALLLHENAAISDPDQAFILREFIRFLSHDSVGVTGFDEMPKSWSRVIDTVRDGGTVRKTGEEAEEIVAAWHEETRDLALRFSRDLALDVKVKLSKTHADDPAARLKDDIDLLSDRNLLKASLSVPDTAGDIVVMADLKARAVRVGMTVDAPKDKARSSARFNWLMRQIKEEDLSNLYVRVSWASRAKDDVLLLAKLAEDSKALDKINPNSQVRAFEVYLTDDSTQKFVGRRKFIETLEAAVPDFYRRVGQHIKPWQPSPPKPKVTAEAEEETPTAQPPPSAEKARPGNDHADLLDIPSFLRRIVGQVGSAG